MASRVLWIASFGFLAAGLATAVYVQTMVVTNRKPGEPKHPITGEMRAETAKQSQKRAPNVALPDQNGKSVQLADAWKSTPAFLIFTIHDCPCSIDAQPFFNQLHAAYGKKVSFVGICRDSQLDASNYVVNMTVPYPMLRDTDKRLIEALGAKNSVYSALVLPGGVIAQVWPGYDQTLSQEINGRLAQAAGMPPVKLSLDHVPKMPTSGCSL